jgi:hypothetical protein
VDGWISSFLLASQSVSPSRCRAFSTGFSMTRRLSDTPPNGKAPEKTR